MKRINNLFDKIISIENLQKAGLSARRGKSKQYGVKLHLKNEERNILNLHEKLKAGTFKTSEYATFKIFEKKEREIFKLPYYP